MSFGELRRLFAHYSGRSVRFVGKYSDWNAAVKATRGYADEGVLARAIAANALVRSGQAVYERDGVAFATPDYPFSLITCLLNVALTERKLSVADFGGGLASTYYQCRKFLDSIEELHWGVIEQAGFATWGMNNLQTPRLSFHDSIEAAGRNEPNVVLLSGVLQYLPDPSIISRQLASLPSVTTVILDRTPLLADGKRATELAVQRVPASIVASSYPAWLFSERELLAPFLDLGFSVEVEWEALDLPMESLTRKVIFKGLLLKKV